MERPQWMKNIPNMTPTELAMLIGERYLQEFGEELQLAAREIAEADSPAGAVIALEGLYKTIRSWELSASASQTPLSEVPEE